MSLLLIVLLPFLGALLPALMIRAGRTACATTTFSFSLIALALLLSHSSAVLNGEVVHASWEWLPGLGLNANFMLDGLGFFFAGLILDTVVKGARKQYELEVTRIYEECGKTTHA